MTINSFHIDYVEFRFAMQVFCKDNRKEYKDKDYRRAAATFLSSDYFKDVKKTYEEKEIDTLEKISYSSKKEYDTICKKLLDFCETAFEVCYM